MKCLLPVQQVPYVVSPLVASLPFPWKIDPVPLHIGYDDRSCEEKLGALLIIVQLDDTISRVDGLAYHVEGVGKIQHTIDSRSDARDD
jgi:hypothetical protein